MICPVRSDVYTLVRLLEIVAQIVLVALALSSPVLEGVVC